MITRLITCRTQRAAGPRTYLEHGKPMIFGKDRNQGIRMNGAHPK